jgi:hypothetical protein
MLRLFPLLPCSFNIGSWRKFLMEENPDKEWGNFHKPRRKTTTSDSVV